LSQRLRGIRQGTLFRTNVGFAGTRANALHDGSALPGSLARQTDLMDIADGRLERSPKMFRHWNWLRLRFICHLGQDPYSLLVDKVTLKLDKSCNNTALHRTQSCHFPKAASWNVRTAQHFL